RFGLRYGLRWPACPTWAGRELVTVGGSVAQPAAASEPYVRLVASYGSSLSCPLSRELSRSALGWGAMHCIMAVAMHQLKVGSPVVLAVPVLVVPLQQILSGKKVVAALHAPPAL